MIKRSINFLPKNKVQNVFNEANLGLTFQKKINNENFEKSETEKETYESIEELKYPKQKNSEYLIVIISVDINEKEITDLRFQAMFRRSTHGSVSAF